MGRNDFLRSVLFVYLGFPLLELALEKGTFWQLIALKLQSKILILLSQLVNRFTAKMFEIVITLCKPRNTPNTFTLHALKAHCMCGSVIKCTCALQPNDCQELCALNGNSLLFVMIELQELIPFCCNICNNAKCYNHACTSDATAVFPDIFGANITLK